MPRANDQKLCGNPSRPVNCLFVAIAAGVGGGGAAGAGCASVDSDASGTDAA
jgi:hypothetical protein